MKKREDSGIVEVYIEMDDKLDDGQEKGGESVGLSWVEGAMDQSVLVENLLVGENSIGSDMDEIEMGDETRRR